MKKQRKISTTGQRKQALAFIIRRVMRDQLVGDASIAQKFGCTKMVTKLAQAGFLERTERKGRFKVTEQLQTWAAQDVVDFIYDRKNAVETKTLKRLAMEGVPSGEAEQQQIFAGQPGQHDGTQEMNKVKYGMQKFIEGVKAGQAELQASGGVTYKGHPYAELEAKINAALEDVQRFGIRDAAAYIASVLPK
jgi:hypothetical protein